MGERVCVRIARWCAPATSAFGPSVTGLVAGQGQAGAAPQSRRARRGHTAHAAHGAQVQRAAVLRRWGMVLVAVALLLGGLLLLMQVLP